MRNHQAPTCRSASISTIAADVLSYRSKPSSNATTTAVCPWNTQICAFANWTMSIGIISPTNISRQGLDFL